MAQQPASTGRQAFTLAGLAVLWSIGLLLGALVAPVYGSATLVDENGSGVLLVMAVPAVLTVGGWLALHRRCRHGGRLSAFLAWTCLVLLAAFCVVGLFSIGILVVPAVLLLACAAALTPPGSKANPPSAGLA